jgi:hypothetical protein
MSEGIYRRSGANSSVTRLLALFRKDAWAVQLTLLEYNEYDVSNVLKRFLRDLPEPLLTTELHSQLCEIAGTFLCLLAHGKLCISHLGGVFHFQHRNSRTFPIESLAHDSGRTLVCAEYGYPKGSPNTNS